MRSRSTRNWIKKRKWKGRENMDHYDEKINRILNNANGYMKKIKRGLWIIPSFYQPWLLASSLSSLVLVSPLQQKRKTTRHTPTHQEELRKQIRNKGWLLVKSETERSEITLEVELVLILALGKAVLLGHGDEDGEE